jgi:hypothetical protein
MSYFQNSPKPSPLEMRDAFISKVLYINQAKASLIRYFSTTLDRLT